MEGIGMNERNKGILLVLGTAIISGVSIFLNKFALASFNPFVFTTLKNSVVALFLLSGLLLTFRYKELLSLKLKDWRNLLAIGIIGGSVPFLLFFWGLAQANAASASLLQKSLFIPASALAFIFLKEKLSKAQLAGAFVLFIGAALFAGVNFAALSVGELAIIGAVLLWSAEDVLSKNVLRSLSPQVVVFGRMFFGSLAMVAFLAATSQMPNVSAFTTSHYIWLLLTSLLLLGYNLTFYSGLKRLKVGEATAALLFGSVVTTALSLTVGVIPSAYELLGAAAVVIGLSAIALFPQKEISPQPVLA
jgi:drug/metabolite transporter (DMT)-like permease